MKWSSAVFVGLAAGVCVFAQSTLPQSLLDKRQKSTGVAEVSGRVVDSAMRTPIAGVRVVVFRMSSGSVFTSGMADEAEPSAGQQDPGGNVFAAVTGDDGRYAMRVGAPGFYQFFARRDGYVPWGEHVLEPIAFEVKPGEQRHDVDLTMDRPASISGRVVDADTGKPLVGVYVMPFRWTVRDGSRILGGGQNSVSTDAKGVYHVPMMHPGEYIVEILPPGKWEFEPGGSEEEFRARTQTDYPGSYFPGVEDTERAQLVTLHPGEAQDGIDVKIAKRRLAAIRGCIHSDASAQETGNVLVVLSRMEHYGSGAANGSAVTRKTLHVGDCFRREGLAPGHYWLTATNQGEESYFFPVADEQTSAETRRMAVLTFELDDRRVEHLDLDMARPAVVAGKTTYPEQIGAERRKPFRVVLDACDRYSVESHIRARTDAAGNFRPGNVMAGAYRVRIFGLPEGLALKEVRYNGVRAGRSTFALNPGAPGHNLELVLGVAGSSLQVNVEDGAKAAGWPVVLVPDDHETADAQADAIMEPAGEDGHATFTGLLAGKYYVSAFPPGTAWRNDPVVARQLITGAEVELATSAAGTIEVKRTATW